MGVKTLGKGIGTTWVKIRDRIVEIFHDDAGYYNFNGKRIYVLTTAITANVTTTSAPAGSEGRTTHATGLSTIFVSDGSKWQAHLAITALTPGTHVAALTDNSGGAAADGTIGAVTAPTAIAATLTDSTGQSGTHDDTLAATTVPTITATNPTAPAAYAAVVNMTDPVTKAEGEAVSAALAALRAEVATYETAISALVVDVAAILSLATVMTQNQSDTAQKVIELVTAQAANRLAIIALQDAAKELATKQNAVITSLEGNAVLAGA